MKKFMIYAGPGIGDTLAVLPTAKAIKDKYGKALVTILIPATKRKAGLNISLVDCLPYVDNVEYYSSSELLHCFFLVIKLRIKKYAYGLVAQYEINENTSPWPSRIMSMAGMETIGLSNDNSEVKFDFTITPQPSLNKAMVVLKLLEPLGISSRYKGEPLLERDCYSGNSPIEESFGNYLVIAPGCGPVPYKEKGLAYSSHNKEWFVENWQIVISMLCNEGYKVVLVGGTADGDSFEALQNKYPISLINLCGKTSITESFGVLSRASLLISCDTGMMHCAGALGVPTLSLFGCTDPAEYAPLGRNAHVIIANTECSPCFGTKMSVTCENRRCMNDITPDMVMNKIVELLNGEIG